MTCDHLVCANCNGRVSEGRCPACRATRARLQEQQGPFAALSPAMLLAVLAGLLAVVLLARQALA
ncbi:hypothetical protein ACIPYS_36740 [Kitasatospora sp. NPDC089913]|uniref:RING-type domain-containing protein n=1 Tax=Kitasatospora purpeofusca TaxID=67352 RepID=A0ABZ1U4H1_9ACTN|nr:MULTISPECIES: hypothetical protein [Streptomycetaceae]KJY38220.1 membrane protein [Streptomyces sp. NRRL S-495]KOV26430.1 membrane protein [Streptomyces sp. XY431]MDY0810205.1 hypothetical protein [Kitasatospora purpeofusca]SDT75544.1 hypothetical protein SAMN05216371_4970 [Streptomyces sp. TLI_053]